MLNSKSRWSLPKSDFVASMYHGKVRMPRVLMALIPTTNNCAMKWCSRALQMNHGAGVSFGGNFLPIWNIEVRKTLPLRQIIRRPKRLWGSGFSNRNWLLVLFPLAPAEVEKTLNSKTSRANRCAGSHSGSFRFRFSNPLGTAHKPKQAKKIACLPLSCSRTNFDIYDWSYQNVIFMKSFILFS